MIRWHSREDAYNLSTTDTRTSQRSTTTTSLCVPIAKVQGLDERTHTHRADVERTVHEHRQSWHAPFVNQPEYTSSTFSAQVDLGEKVLPLISLPLVKDNEKQLGAVGEGIATGATNATTGALVGFGLGLVFCPPAAGLWALVGGAGSGTVSGVAQTVHVAVSNSNRNFAAKINEWLLICRAEGVTNAAKAKYTDLNCLASNDDQRVLLEQARRMVLEFFPGSNLVPVYFPSTATPSGSSSGMHQGYNHSPAGAVSFAMGGR